ncbi:MAG: OmpA family protein [Termitinemataceae bacterium]
MNYKVQYQAFFGRLLLAFYVLLQYSIGQALWADRFVFSYSAGDMYRVVSTVQEDVYVNRRFSHQAEILNKIAVTITGVNNGIARHEATFQTSERSVGASSGRVFQWSQEYKSIFNRDSFGRFTIAPEYFMPVVRNVPLFPDRELAPGDTWSAEGEEVHDFRTSFGIPEPYRIPFTANYAYLGTQKYKEKTYPAISVSYRIFYEAPGGKTASLWPYRIMGASDQKIYWDLELGQPAAYTEQFRMIFELSNGQTVEYRGTAQAEIIEAKPMNRDAIAKEITRDIIDKGIANTTVRVVPEGITISLENIQFEADSAILLPTEKAKLEQIAEILKRYPDRDILIGGHTALAGTAEGRAKLSQERAATVADYLIRLGARRSEQVIVRGFGAERPVADNSTEEGRQRNRRVEITILEN